MKISLTLEEAIAYIRDHEDLAHLVQAEIVIEGFEATTPVVEEEPKEEKPKQKRTRRTKKQIQEEANVETQEQLDAIVAEVEQEIADEAIHSEATVLPSIDEPVVCNDTASVAVSVDEPVNEEVIVDEIISTESSEERESSEVPVQLDPVPNLLDDGINVEVQEDLPWVDAEMSLIDEVLAEEEEAIAEEVANVMDIHDVTLPYAEREAYAKANGLVVPLF